MADKQSNSASPNRKKPPPQKKPNNINIQDIVAKLTIEKANLEVENRRLKTEIKAVTETTHKLMGLYTSAPIGYFIIDSNGVIQEVNPFGAEFLGTNHNALIQKPFSLYILEEDLIIFFIHRKNLLTEKKSQSFMIRMNKANREVCDAMLTISSVPAVNDTKPQIKILLEDKTLERKGMNSLQKKNNMLNFLFSIINEVAALKGAQKTEAIIENLEILALLLGVDRIFFVLISKKNNPKSNTYKWCSENWPRKFDANRNIMLRGDRDIFNILIKRGIIELTDIPKTIAPRYRNWLKSFPPGIRSIFRTAVIHQDQVRGILGYECIETPKKASEDEIGLLEITAKLLYFTLEKSPKRVTDAFEIYTGPIEIMPDNIQPFEKKDEFETTGVSGLTLDPCTYGETKNLMRIFPQKEKMVVSCPNCKTSDLFSATDLIANGKTFKVTCRCRTESFILIEMRKYYRKPVNLFGFYISKSHTKTKDKHQWGRINIKNISKFGIGFELEEYRSIQVNDTLNVKFSLDNNTNTNIRKDVEVKSIKDRYIGCQFISKDQNDVTLGFYLMSR